MAPSLSEHTRSSADTFEYCDPLDCFGFSSADADLSAPANVWVEPPAKPRRFIRIQPEFHSDPDHVGLFSGFAQDTIVSPPPFIATVRNARLVGFRTTLTETGFFFNDDSIQGRTPRNQFLKELAMPYPFSELTGLRPLGTGERFALDLGTRRVLRVRGTVVVLSSAEPSNYGSWLFRVLPKFHARERFLPKKRLRYLVWCEHSTFQEYLYLLGVSADQIIHHDPENVVYQIQRAIIPSMRNNQAFLDPESVAFFAEMRDKFGCRQKEGMRIYVSRVSQTQNGHSRAMLNELDLVAKLVQMGFRIVEPESLPVATQISVFSSAEMVVGPSGSGMFNTVFCHPGTKVIDIESEPHWIHAHRNLFASCGLRYGIFVGSSLDRDYREHHKPWRVNIGSLISQIERWS